MTDVFSTCTISSGGDVPSAKRLPSAKRQNASVREARDAKSRLDALLDVMGAVDSLDALENPPSPFDDVFRKTKRRQKGLMAGIVFIYLSSYCIHLQPFFNPAPDAL